MANPKFLEVYENIKFKETEGNPFRQACNLRRNTAVSYLASCERNDNYASCFLLSKNLERYAEVADDRFSTGVDNYSKAVLAILGNFRNDNSKQWESGLKHINAADYLTPLPCSDSLICPATQLRNHELNILMKNKDSFVQPKQELAKIMLTEQTKVTRPTINPPSFVSQKQMTSRHDITDNNQNNTRDMFKSASHELKLQNMKKYGCSNSSEVSYVYGSGKRSLGGRRGSANSRFRPPIKSNQDNDYNDDRPVAEDENDTVVDERLKNIDVKMIELIKNEIMHVSSTVTWDDIAGLEFAKATIQEIVVWPMLRPDIFTGLRRPPRGILLFGPPGTGKTLIGKCIASQSKSTFFSISASSLTSKWIGDGEKMVRALFAVARCHQPAVIFIDEIDSLLSQRSDQEHESSRRIKTEFLVQLDGAGTGEDDRILIIGATNRPQELDEAARRRLVKRLYIPLPNNQARIQLMHNLLKRERHVLTSADMAEIADMTEGYSGADMKNVCQESSLGPIRSIPGHQIEHIDPSQVRPVNLSDFKSALTRVKSSVGEKDLLSYLEWDKQFGCGK